MVALIRPNNLSDPSQPRSNRSRSSHPDTQLSRRRGHLKLVVNQENVVGSELHSVRSAASRRPLIHSVPQELDLAQIGVIAAAMAFVVFGFLLSIRLVQGSPDPSLSLAPSFSQNGLVQDGFEQAGVEQAGVEQGRFEQGPIRPAGYSGDLVVVAEPGDSMWSIAIDLGATDNPQTAVEALIDANGGSSVTVGQQIIVPEQLVN